MNTFLKIAVIPVFIISCVSPKTGSPRKISSVDGFVPLPIFSKITPEEREIKHNRISNDLCMNQVCGPASKNLDYEAILREEQNSLAKYKSNVMIYSKIDRVLRLYFSQMVQHDGYKKNVYDYFLKHPEYRLPQNYKAFFNLIYYTQLYMVGIHLGLQTRPDQYVDWNLFEEKFFDLVPVSNADKDWAKKVYRTGAYAHISQAGDENQFFKDPFAARFLASDKYPDIPFHQGLKKLLQECRGHLHELDAALGVKMFTKMFPICSGQTPFFDERTLGLELSQLGFVKLWTPKNVHPVILEREWDWKTSLQRYANTQEYRIRQRIPYVPASAWQPVVDEAVQKCHEKIGPSVEMSPNAQKTLTVQGILLNIKRTSKKLISFRNPQIQERFNKGVDRTGFSLPPAQNILIKNIVSRFTNLTQASRETRHILEDPTRPEFALNLLDVMGIRPMDNGPEETLTSYARSTVSMALEDCDPYVANGLSDFMYSITGESMISWSSVKYLEVGYGIIAHEMGHRVSQLLQQIGESEKGPHYLGLSENLPLWERRSCINSFHGRTTQRALNNENYKTEEDWADYFSALIQKENQDLYPWLKNMGCALTDKDRLRKNSYEVEYKEKDSDSHSNGAFRAIHIEKTLGGLTPACTNSLKQKNHLPSCFF